MIIEDSGIRDIHDENTEVLMNNLVKEALLKIYPLIDREFNSLLEKKETFKEELENKTKEISKRKSSVEKLLAS